MDAILFYSVDIKFVLKEKTKIRAWINSCAKKEGKKIEALNYIFCSDNHLLEINKKHLNHNTFTDTITFGYSGTAKNVVGDIYISVDRVKENAKTYNETFNQEIKRVAIHGFLHLCGYSDKGVEKRKAMVKRENIHLKGFTKMFHVEH